MLAAIATALSDPTFDFDLLFKLDAVLAAQAHLLFAFLRMLLGGGLDDLHAWQHAHADTAEEHGTYARCPSPFYVRLSNDSAKMNKVNAGLDSSAKCACSPSPTSDSRTPSRTLRASSRCSAGSRNPSGALGYDGNLPPTHSKTFAS